MFTHTHAEECQPPRHRRLHHSLAAHIGGSKNFRGGPNTSVEFGPGVQILRDRPLMHEYIF